MESMERYIVSGLSRHVYAGSCLSVFRVLVFRLITSHSHIV